MRVDVRTGRAILAGAIGALVIAFVCTILAVGTALPVNEAHAEEFDLETSRAIAIGYDNSGSMANGSDKWCNAQYSLEVLAAMMGGRDVLSLYAMDAEGEKLHLTGDMDAEARAATVHNADLGVSDWTDPRAARDAYQWLLGQQADEKYLVITTDGDFNVGGGLDDVRQVVNDATSQGITVIYLAIGDQAEVIAANEAGGVYVKTASGGEILRTMTEIANLTFGRAPLESTMYTQSGDLSLEVPMGKLIVFAQGANVSVGSMKTSNGDTIDPSVAKVRYRDRMTDGENRYGGDNPNTGLQGVVATFDAAIPKGDAKVGIEGAESVEIYYQPNVNIAIELQDETGYTYTLEPGGANKLTQGTYKVSYAFLDPDTGETLDSKLLSPANFSLTVDNGGSMNTVGEGEPIELERGTAVVRATAETPGGGKAKQQYPDVRVIPPAVPLEIGITNRPDSPSPIDIHELDVSEPLKIHVTKEGGDELTVEEWADTSFDVNVAAARGLFNAAKKLGVEVTKTEAIGDFELKLSSNEGNIVNTLSGEVPIEMQALCDQEDVQYRGARQEIAHITNPSILDYFLFLLPLIIGTLLILAFILWLLGAGRISKRFWNGIDMLGWRAPVSCLGNKPKRIGGSVAGLVTNKWEWTGACNAPIPGPKGRNIKLHGKYFRFGRMVSFVNYAEWRAAGWRLVGKSKNPNKIKPGMKMEHAKGGYTIRFGAK